MVCVNYKNQVAIDRIIQSANERMRRRDEFSGIKNPPLFYDVGTMCCDECADAGNPDWMKNVFDEAKGGESGFHRICFTPDKE